ncbi:MAG TPA: Hsp20/alpha crystallin family protein [Phycisphaerales bacterium]|nr:Hsp20/alpha crystallin family protein [Phycisphaerales bacterium]
MAKTPKKETRQELEPTIQKAEPVSRALSPFEEMDRLFEAMMPRRWMRPMRWEWPSLSDIAQPFEGRMPKVDVIDRDNEILVKAELPGVKKEDIDISVSDNSITLRGCTSHESKEEKGDYYRMEMSRGEFTRTLTLPADVDSDKAKAAYKDGVLELTLPKLTKSKRRAIKVE